MTTDTPLPTLADVETAARHLEGVAVRTPLLSHPVLDELTGGRILLKPENLQRVGAFKFRGAYNRLTQVDAARFPGGVVACSSGNHAQGVAEAARILGIKAAIVMPADAPRMKIERTRASGAEVILYDRRTEDREAIARGEAKNRRADFVHPFDDPGVIAGQGTVGLEMIADAEAMGQVFDDDLVCCSGGGLASGIALAVAARMPDARVLVVEPADFDDFTRSLETGTRQRNRDQITSIADALLMSEPGHLTFEIGRKLFAGGLRVTDLELRRAMRFAFIELKLVLEPGGAAALAAVLSGKLPTAGRTIGVVLSGGNVDPDTFAKLIRLPD